MSIARITVAALASLSIVASTPSARHNKPEFKCVPEIVSAHLDSILARWPRGDMAGTQKEFASDSASAFSVFNFGPVHAAHHTELAEQLAKWQPEPGLHVTGMTVVGYNGDYAVLNVGPIQIGTSAKPATYLAKAGFNCRLNAFTVLSAGERQP